VVIFVLLILAHKFLIFYRHAKYENDIRDYLETCRKQRVDALYGRLPLGGDESEEGG
tara:strand:- start:481 stop:651 length:171 start_codon:yes stop_codon:yes gene_type:complete